MACTIRSRSNGPYTDTWAVDFGLLDAQGQLLGNPYHYRDRRTEGVPQHVDQRVPPQRLYTQTGIQQLPINTLYQLVSMQLHHDPQLAAARTLLLMPDLFPYWMTGRTVAEYTNASTTQFFDARERHWATELLEALELPVRILPPIVQPGTVLGDLLPDVRAEVGLREDVAVIATATHDTASAVVAIPGLDERSAYISSGTWSLVGVETATPILTEDAHRLSFTNEGGVEYTIRFLKNVGGLWLVQECQRQWQWEGQTFSWPELVALAEAAPPLRNLVDPDAPEFLNPGNMPAAIRDYCRRTSQAAPEGIGALVRCLFRKSRLEVSMGGCRPGGADRPSAGHHPHCRWRESEHPAVPAHRRCVPAAGRRGTGRGHGAGQYRGAGERPRAASKHCGRARGSRGLGAASQLRARSVERLGCGEYRVRRARRWCSGALICRRAW